MASVKVAIRVRPFNQRECDMNAELIVTVDGKKTRILNQKVAQGKDGDLGRERYKDFTFDHSYWSFDEADKNFASQERVFEDLGTDVIDSAYEGYNACVFAYGQTGSGKTFTMMGTPENQGLIPRICQTLFSRMAKGKAAGASYRTEVSYLEIYNERVKDLLTPSDQHSLRVREHPRLGPYVQDLSYHLVTDYQHIQELMHRGNMQRTTASTNMNNTSSRSHAIFTLTFAQAGFNNEMMPSETVSKVHLVDLAGSERADSSGATGQRLKEGAHINKSLVTLGSVISALAELSANAGPRRTSVFIPYRDSVLTWLLKDSLGGNSKTIMIAAISPADCNYGETLSTLRYANRAKNIINKPTINEDPNVRLIRDLREEISKLKALLGNEFTVESHVLERELHQMEAQEKVLTEEWAEKWRETQQILHEQKALGLRKAGLGVVLDSDMPHLVGIDDDLLSTGVTLYHLRDGETLIGTEDAEEAQDIMLNGNGVEPEHCRVVLSNGVATLIPLPHAQCWVNTVPVDKPTKLSQGCIILLGRTNMFRYNDPVEAAKMRKEGSRSHLNLSRLSLLSFSTPDLAWSTENLSALIVSEDPEQVEELELQKAMLVKEREAFRREQVERERDWEREQREKKELLERAQMDLDSERQKLEREYAAQCRQLAQDWRRLEQRQLESLETMREREAELNQRREMLEVEKGTEETKVASEYSKVAELTAKLEVKKEEFGMFMSRVLSQLETLDGPNGLQTRRAVKTLQLLAAERLTPEKKTTPLSESSSESFASFGHEPENIKNVVNTHKRELAELESEIRERVSTLHERQENISKMESELGVITSSLEVGSSELKAMREALAKRSEEQLMEISQKKQSLSLDLRRTTNVQRPESEDGDSSDLLLSPAATDTYSSSLGTGETFHTAGSVAAEGICLETTLKLVNGSMANGSGDVSSPEVSNGATADSEESEVSSTEDRRKLRPAGGYSENSTSSFEKVSPLTEIQNGGRIRRPRVQNSKYCRAARQNAAHAVQAGRSVSQLMRSMKRLCQLVTHQKMLIMQSLENDCEKAELDAQIAVLQDLQRQYVRLEVTLDQHPLRPLTVDNVGSSEESDNQSTSADDGMSDLMADAKSPKSPKLDNDFREVGGIVDVGGGGDASRSQYDVALYSELSSHEADSRCSPGDFQPNLLTVSNFFLRGVGSSTHYEYEVIIVCAAGDRWNVLRRFKRFRELHLTMRLRYGSPVEALSFPRRTFFSKNTESIARRRRGQLEQYLRALVSTCAAIPSCPLHDCSAGITRLALLEFSAFFRKGIFETGKYGTS